jgi:hypothetical protein
VGRPEPVRALFGSLNTREFNVDVANCPANMPRVAPGINPSRWTDG